MNEPLTPAEVDELWPANEPKHLEMHTMTWRLIQTIDALAAALRAADKNFYPDRIGTHWEGCESVHPWCAYAKARAHVATWLEDEVS
jgi:hypothetical protein